MRPIPDAAVLPAAGPLPEAAAYRAGIAATREARFVREATTAGAVVEVVTAGNLAGAIADLLTATGGGVRVGMPRDGWAPRGARWPSADAVAEALAARGHVVSRWPDADGGVAGIERLDAGITAADWALAETGSLVFIADREAPRGLSLWPPVHIAVLDSGHIVSDLHDLLDLVGGDPASAITIVTGPSRSADIEMSLTIGVHGPAMLRVLVVDDGDATN